jgi:autotransporter-associated beta strand protein
LGTVAAGTVIASGATLDLNGYNLSTAEALIINGSGVSNAGALANSSATSATYSGLLTLGSNATIRAGTAITGDIVLTNPGTITGSGFSLTLGGTGSASSLASIVGTGSGNLIKADSGTWTLTGDNTYTGTTTITAGILGVGSGGTTGRLGSGALASGLASLIINRSDNVSLSTLVPNGGSVNIARQGYVRVSTGGLTLDRSITASGQIELISSGNIISTTGYVQGNSLLLQGSNITLTHASNNINTLAAVATGSLTFTESSGFIIGTYSGVSGLTAGGAISVSTATGNLTVSANVSTTDTTAYAILLNAGRTTAAGTSTGGDLIVSGTPTLTAGTGGTIRLMTGSVSGSTGLTALVGSGTGRFRYNSDEVADRYTTALSPNVINAIYRESRAVTVSGLGSTVTYGDTLSPSASGTVNGDTISLVVGSPLYSSAGLLRYQGTPYNLSSNLSGLGYIVTGLPATLTVNRKDLTVTGLNSADKVYDGSNAASLSGTAALQTAVTVPAATVPHTLAIWSTCWAHPQAHSTARTWPWRPP